MNGSASRRSGIWCAGPWTTEQHPAGFCSPAAPPRSPGPTPTAVPAGSCRCGCVRCPCPSEASLHRPSASRRCWTAPPTCPAAPSSPSPNTPNKLSPADFRGSTACRTDFGVPSSTATCSGCWTAISPIRVCRSAAPKPCDAGCPLTLPRPPLPPRTRRYWPPPPPVTEANPPRPPPSPTATTSASCGYWIRSPVGARAEIRSPGYNRRPSTSLPTQHWRPDC
jgi:hypothetical protein